MTVVQQGGQYQLDGEDDQCAAAENASVAGLAFQNPNATIGFGLTIVNAPGATPGHVAATISIATLSGTRQDSSGDSGSFTFTPGGGTCAVLPAQSPIVVTRSVDTFHGFSTSATPSLMITAGHIFGATGDGIIIMGLPAPPTIGSAQYRLSSVEYCLARDTTNSAVVTGAVEPP